MTSRIIKHAIWLTLAVGAAALAAPGGTKGPPDGKGNKPPTEVGNNLSVPAIMAGGVGAFASLDCPLNGLSNNGFSDLTLPDKSPVFYPASCAPTNDGEVCVAEGNYYVQRDASWQAPCKLVMSPGIDVLGRWGDNLTGTAMLKVGSPIRVELVLLDGGGLADTQQGYYVIKLEPDELDRVSDYGHLAGGSGTDEDPFVTIPYTVGELLPDGETSFAAIVHDPDATLRIELLDDGVPVSPAVYDGPAGGEINATGKIVYGYNLRVTEAGTYRITYTIPHGNFASNDETVPVCDAGTCTGNEAYLDIVVTAGGGGRKGGD